MIYSAILLGRRLAWPVLFESLLALLAATILSIICWISPVPEGERQLRYVELLDIKGRTIAEGSVILST